MRGWAKETQLPRTNSVGIQFGYDSSDTKEGITMRFAENLVYLRQHYGVTQEGLAEQLGVSRQTISKWEAGANYPEMDKLLVLCDLFNTNLDDLLRGSVLVAKESDTEIYDRHMNRYDLSIVAGVVLILVGVGINLLLSAFGWPGNLQTVALLSCVVVGVVIMVIGSINHSEFKRRNPSIEPRYSPAVLERFSRRYPLMIGAGVGIILLDVIFLVGLSPDNSSLDFVRGVSVEEFVIAPFLFILAAAVGLLIEAGMQKSKYELSELTFVTRHPEVLVNLPTNAIVKSPEQIRVDRIMGVICGCIMLLATIVFLVWGFVPLFDQIGQWNGMDKSALKHVIKEGQGGFSLSWISFVVGGLLCGIVCLVGSLFGKSKEDLISKARQEDAWMQLAAEEASRVRDPWTYGSSPVAHANDQVANSNTAPHSPAQTKK